MDEIENSEACLTVNLKAVDQYVPLVLFCGGRFYTTTETQCFRRPVVAYFSHLKFVYKIQGADCVFELLFILKNNCS